MIDAEPAATNRPRGDAYLPEEPLLVLHAAGDGVQALVTDVRDTWRVTWGAGRGWACTCPAVTVGCGHIGAVRALVVLERVEPTG